MKYAEFVANDWDKLDHSALKMEQSRWVHRATAYLKDYQEPSGDDGSEVKSNAHFHVASAQKIPFSRR